MTDIAFMLFVLLASASVGAVAASRSSFSGRYFAAPVVGFGAIATVATLAYRYGASAQQCTWIIVALALVSALLSAKGVARDWSRGSIVPASAIIVIALVAILPKWSGGEQFYAFQINPVDQANYLKVTTAYSAFSYETVKNPPDWWEASGNMYSFATSLLDLRPGVNILQAAFMAPLFETAIEAYYPYMAALQVLMALAVAFIALQVSPERIFLALILGGGFALGPLFQHTIDLNAWSQTAGMPIAFAAIGLASACLRSENPRIPLLASLTAALCGVLFIYPEIGALVAVAGAVMAVTHLTMIRSLRPVLLSGAAALSAVAVSALYFSGTIGALVKQVSVSVNNPFLDWAIYYDGQLLGRDVDYGHSLVNEIPLLNYEIASLPIDIAMGALGLFYFLPTVTLAIHLRVLWKVLAVVFMAALGAASLNAIFCDKKVWPLFAGLAGCLVIPAYMLTQGSVWSAGKALGMAAPATFILVVLPLLSPSIAKWAKAPATVLLVVHLAFGLARIVLASNLDGIPYPPPYPSAGWKPVYEWSVTTRHRELVGCQGVHLNIKDAILDTYNQTALTGYGIEWRSLQRIRPYYDFLEGNVYQAPGNADCLVTDMDATDGYRVVIDLRR